MIMIPLTTQLSLLMMTVLCCADGEHFGHHPDHPCLFIMREDHWNQELHYLSVVRSVNLSINNNNNII